VFSEDVTIPSGGHKTKEIAQTIFGQFVFKREEFQLAGLLGSHSIQKFASTATYMTARNFERATTKTFEVVGNKARSVSQMFMMI
jgi:hypothetical protein